MSDETRIPALFLYGFVCRELLMLSWESQLCCENIMPLKAVIDNPFRVLGVYSNAKPAEIVSNCDDMEAYLSIGQSVSFELDLNNLMPELERSADSVDNAKKRINLPKDKLKYALFWFFKDSSSEHAMNHLKNGDFGSANSVFEIEDSFSTRINQSVVALMQNNLGTAISRMSEMIHDGDYRDAFVKAICGTTFTLGEDEMAHLYIDTLLEEIPASTLMESFQENGVLEEDEIYLKEKAVDEPISRINTEISKAKSVARNDADANYRTGMVLMQNTKNDLAKVKNMLGASDMRYQMLADDLANTILQCGINYFNNSDDDDDIEKALTIQQYACNIAVGKLCRDRCNQNVAILKKKKEEQAISSDLSFIAGELQSFKSKTSSIDNAKNFVNICIPHLNNIKNQLGSSNVLYLQISSAVANNALGMLVSVINDAQNISSSPYSYSSPLTNIKNLKSKIDSAINVMNLIGGLDMDSNTQSRFDTNKKTLLDIQLKLHHEPAKSALTNATSHSPSNSSYTGTTLSPKRNNDKINWIIVIIIHLIWGIIGWISAGDFVDGFLAGVVAAFIGWILPINLLVYYAFKWIKKQLSE